MKTHVLSHICCIENNAFYKILQEMWQRLQGQWNIWWWSERMWCHEDVIYMLGKWGNNTHTAQFAIREITQWIECEVHVCAQVSLQALTVCTLDFLIIVWLWGAARTSEIWRTSNNSIYCRILKYFYGEKYLEIHAFIS